MAKFSTSLSITLLCVLLVVVEVESSLDSEGIVLIAGNSTILSQNNSFELGFFSYNGESGYLGMWYASLPIRTYVWVVNRQNSVKNLTSAKLRLKGQLEIIDSNGIRVWHSENIEKATQLKFLDTGNLLLLSDKGDIVWESFQLPTDTWLPGMKISGFQFLSSWRSAKDPSPGNYILRLRQSDFGAFELVFNNSFTYWSSGKWDGTTFPNVPEMSSSYLYDFKFENPFNSSAFFIYTEVSSEFNLKPLTRFYVDSYGQFKQYSWSSQNGNWNNYLSQPDANICDVYGLCGNLGFCSGSTFKPCECLTGFHPSDDLAWESGDFTGGCRRDSQDLCYKNDMFEEIGVVIYDNSSSVIFPADRNLCEKTCLKNCSCLGLNHDERSAGRRNVETQPSGGKGDVKEDTTDEKWFFPPWAARKIIEGNVARIVDDRLVGAYDTVEAERVALVAVWCIQDEESTRPTMGTVVKMLEGTVEVTVPPAPQLLQALVSGDSFHGVRDDTNQDPSTGCNHSDDSNHTATGVEEITISNQISSRMRRR
ncbi:G-type lectin S-receptor-like serine/threonine-protein kinase SD2-2 [Thalictrum thalictroides]|uniref:G-type lectin S-receptor-like serine/threonine-protein kinase SD2-2 n=1 Tax=Thalictrum thalictroides TaxID=46969 RepID=A0A7J6WND5_THATH|nr:G-type lectin S-receptor-like serine/threonine-protein kinase SD2-2 [Thalictrum thalictroides]